MADKSDRAFVIGWGTGITVGELARLEGTKEVTVAEISRAVINTVPLFEPFNLRAATNKKVTLIGSDAYRALTRSQDDFDLIISEPSNPWVTGVEMLYSREFLQLAHDRLSPGGVYAQWCHLYETDSASVELVLRTYASVFEHVSVWSGSANDLLILGFREVGPAVDYLRLISRAKQADFKAALARMRINSIPELLAREIIPVGVLHAVDLQGPLHTLYHPRLSDLAGRGFFRRETAELPFTGFGEAARIGARNSLLHRYTSYIGEQLSDQERAAAISHSCSSLGGSCAAMVAKWMSEDPLLPDSDEFKASHAWALSYLRFRKKQDPETVLRDLATLFSESSSQFETKTPDFAARISDHYTEFYTHVAPFSPDALVNTWSRCRVRSRTRQECTEYVQKLGEVTWRAEVPVDLIERCMSTQLEGPDCRAGSERARRILKGDLSYSRPIR